MNGHFQLIETLNIARFTPIDPLQKALSIPCIMFRTVHKYLILSTFLPQHMTDPSLGKQ